MSKFKRWSDFTDGEKADILTRIHELKPRGMYGKPSWDDMVVWLKKEYNLEIGVKTLTARLAEFRKSFDSDANRGQYFMKTDYYKNRWKGLCDFANVKPDKIKKMKAKNKKHKRIMLFSDTHCPWCDLEMLAKALAVESSKEPIDEIHIVGDVLDCYAMSSFIKTKIIPLEKEVADGIMLLQMCAKYAPVKVYDDNHSKRVLKYFLSRNIQPEYMWLVNTDILQEMCNNIDNVEMMRPTFDIVDGSKMTTEGFGIVGDAVIGHFELASAIDMKTVGNVQARFDKWLPFLNIERRIRCYAQAHTHRAGKTFPYPGIMRIELGCMLTAGAVEYALAKGSLKWAPPVRAYTMLVQENGRTIFNETYQRLLDENV